MELLGHRNELLSHEKTWRNLKCLLPSERKQSEGAAYCMFPMRGYSGKAKLSNSKTIRVKGEGGRDKQSTDFQGAKTLPYAVCHYACVKTQRTHNTGSKPCVHADFGQQCATVRSCTNVLSWCGSVVGKAVRVWSRGVWEVSVLSSQVCCDPKTALKPS